MGGGGGRAPPLKGYGLVALSWVLPSLYRPWGCPRVPPIPAYDLGKVREPFWAEIPPFSTFFRTIQTQLYGWKYCSGRIVSRKLFVPFWSHFFIRTPFWVFLGSLSLYRRGYNPMVLDIYFENMEKLTFPTSQMAKSGPCSSSILCSLCSFCLCFVHNHHQHLHTFQRQGRWIKFYLNY